MELMELTEVLGALTGSLLALLNWQPGDWAWEAQQLRLGFDFGMIFFSTRILSLLLFIAFNLS